MATGKQGAGHGNLDKSYVFGMKKEAGQQLGEEGKFGERGEYVK